MWPWKEQAVGELFLSWYSVPHRRHLFCTFISFNGWCWCELGIILSFEDTLIKVLEVGFAILIWEKPRNKSAITSSLLPIFIPLYFFSPFNNCFLFFILERRKKWQWLLFLIGLEGYLLGFCPCFFFFSLFGARRKDNLQNSPHHQTAFNLLGKSFTNRYIIYFNWIC